MLRRCALLAAALAAAARAVPAAVVQAPLQDAEGSAGGGVRPSPEIAAYLDFVDAVAAQAQGGQQEGRGAHAPSTAEGLFSAAGDPTPLYNGIATFMHLDNIDCTSSAADGKFDIGVVGMPFDLGVTYRPGARFGPSAARMASRRIAPGTTE
ncbi:hypothetical protein KEM52_001181 [Ascosphaera acerosa]|nr:hypothetical protein KEM52_001181 [Ascosphaera acerosa]